jgi:PAS domain S-box-containing protein
VAVLAAFALRGLTQGVIQGKSHYELIPDMPEHWKEAHSRGLAGEILKGEDTWIALDGNTHTILWTIHPWGGSGTNPAGIILFSEDITERKRAEEALRASQERMSAIVGSAMDAVITLNADQHIMVFNAAAEEIFGCPATEALGQSLDRFIPAQFRETHRRQVRDFGSTGTTSRSMYSPGTLLGLRATGEEFPLEANVSHVAVAGEKLYTVILRDVTQRRQAEEILREKEERFRAMYEHAAVGIEQVATDGRLLMVNPALCHMLGYSETELLSSTFEKITHPDDRERERTVLDSLMSGDRDYYEIEKRYIHREGGTVWVNVISSSVKDPTGRPLYRISIIQDVTQRKQAEDQLLQGQKMEAVGRLAGGLAHDFNTLLSVILGYSELALAELPTNDPSHARFEQIEKSAQTGATLTKQLLAFSRKKSVTTQVVDLREIVAGLEPMLRRLLPEDIEIVAHCAHETCPVNADPSQLQQVLLNLAVNAGHAMPKGGSLTIEVKPVQVDGQVQQTASMMPGVYEMLAVSDTGSGMDAGTVAHIFEPFFTTKSEGEGTGLGLATVYGIVKQSGGDVLVSSKPGSGSIFSVYLPR